MIGADTAARESFIDSMLERFENEVVAEALREKLRKLLPNQVVARSVDTPAFGAVTPGFGLDSFSPSEPAAVSPPLQEAPEAAAMIRIGSFEFLIGERVKFGNKEGLVVAIASDGKRVRVLYGEKLIKLEPERLERVENLFDILN